VGYIPGMYPRWCIYRVGIPSMYLGGVYTRCVHRVVYAGGVYPGICRVV